MPDGFVTTVHITAADVQATFGNLIQAERTLRAKGRVAQANEVALIYRRTTQDFRRIQREISTLGTQKIKRRLEMTRVRPEKGKHTLRDGIQCAPIVTNPPIAGVGFARISDLDKVVNPERPSSGTYWRAQEYGTRAHLGRTLTGHFYGPRGGNRAPADPGQFRRHSTFRAEQGPLMTIKKPLRARYFIRDGTNEAVRTWRLRVRAAELRMVRDIELVRKGLPAAGARRAITRRTPRRS